MSNNGLEAVGSLGVIEKYRETTKGLEARVEVLEGAPRWDKS